MTGQGQGQGKKQGQGQGKRAVLYVFSGTGNTRLAADKIAEGLRESGMQTTVYEVRAPFTDAPDPNGYDVCGFGYPIHAFNAPQFFLRFVRGLPAVQPGKYAFVFKTSGEPFHANSASSYSLMRLLKGKGFAPAMDRHLLMPYNIMFRYNDALAKQMYLHTLRMAAMLADTVAEGRREKLRYYPWTVALMYLLRLQWFGAWINGPLTRANRQKCAACGRCAMECPAGNITMRDGLPQFGWKCTMCMRCTFRCPRDAVRPGFLNAWRVNGPYPFEKLAANDAVPATYVNADTKGYFRLFRRYYRRTERELAAYEASVQQAAEAAASRQSAACG